LQADEPEFTRNKVRIFLTTHTCYELIPESGKVVILDVGLPIRQAFHALHEQVTTLLYKSIHLGKFSLQLRCFGVRAIISTSCSASRELRLVCTKAAGDDL